MSEIVKNEALARLASQVASESITGQIEDLIRRVDTLPTMDSRPESEILDYGDDGIPR
jgi:hypothetical protein